LFRESHEPPTNVRRPCCLSGTEGEFGEKDKEKEHPLEKLANKVPVEIAGPVLIALYLIYQLPSILDRIHGPAQTEVLEIVIGALVLAVVFSLCLYAVSNYKKALWRPRSKARQGG
jgi:hypothetical protein